METIFSNSNQNVCIICQKILSSKQNLKQHMNIHTGNKPYSCTYPGCTSSYKHASQLSSHKFIHSKNGESKGLLIDDFKSFIELIIQALTQISKPALKIPTGPYKKQDVLLPPLTLIKLESKLPSLFKGLE